MTTSEARTWVLDHDDADVLDDAELDAACRALGYDPDYLAGDDEDPIDRRWDTVAADAVRS